MSQIREKDIISSMVEIHSKLVLLMRSHQGQVENGQKKALRKCIRTDENLILCSKTLRDSGVVSKND